MRVKMGHALLRVKWVHTLQRVKMGRTLQRVKIEQRFNRESSIKVVREFGVSENVDLDL